MRTACATSVAAMLNQGHILAVAMPTPTPSPTESAAAVTLDTFSLLWRTVLGLSIGLVLALAVVIAVHVAGRRSLLWHHVGDKGRKIGRASCRERVCQYV